MKYEMHKDRLDIWLDGQKKWATVSDFLNEYHQSKKNVYALIQGKELLMDQDVIHDVHQHLNGHMLTILLKKQKPDWPMAKKECKVVYEDDFIYVAHKDPGIIIHNHEDPLNCLNAQASRYQSDHGISFPVRPIHRLDKETTGLVIYSKVPFFQPWLDAELEEKRISRHYLAIVSGRMKPGSFTIHQKIGRDRHISNKYRVSDTGKDAVTHFKVLASRDEYSLIRCTLETGRTHQIRVHLAWYGHPIVNDALYGNRSNDFKHMGLWADEIEFTPPLSSKRYKVIDVTNSDFEYFKRGKNI